MTTTWMDLNSDLGEGFGVWRLGDDDALLGLVTSANAACGFHAGDPSIMRHVCREAVARGVSVGAQVSYNDLAGFGRRHLEVPPDVLTDDILYQIGALDAFARAAGDRVRYVKPHGALYNRVVDDEVQAAAVVRAVVEFDASLPLLGLPGSALLRLAADAGLDTVPEAFADRAYTPRGTLAPRGEAGAVVHDPDEVAKRAVMMVVHGEVVALDGSVVPVDARSLCLHGDTAGAVELAQRVRSALVDAGVQLRAFA